jgi:hypothetical protein
VNIIQKFVWDDNWLFSILENKTQKYRFNGGIFDKNLYNKLYKKDVTSLAWHRVHMFLAISK